MMFIFFLGVGLLDRVSEMTVQPSDKCPVIIQLLLAELDGVHRDVYLQLGNGVLHYPEINGILVFSFGVPDYAVY